MKLKKHGNYLYVTVEMFNGIVEEDMVNIHKTLSKAKKLEKIFLKDNDIYNIDDRICKDENDGISFRIFKKRVEI